MLNLVVQLLRQVIEMVNKFGFVYITINKINGKRYVGKCEYARLNGWKNYLGSGKYLKEDIKTFGKENFTRVILDECDNDDELCEVEEYYIRMFKAVESDNFYNMKYSAKGGDTFTNHPDKDGIRKKKSYNSTGERNPMYGVEKSDLMIRSVKEANSKPIEIDGVRYGSITEASNKLGLNLTTICYRLDTPKFTNYIRLKKNDK